MFAPIVTDLLRYPSLPESEGKDRTMMKNMMGMEIGAMAINGGIGVMEIRQPTVELPSADDVVKMVAQAAADLAGEIAENAHITLRELKRKVAAVTEKKLPSFKQLMEQNPVAVAKSIVNMSVSYTHLDVYKRQAKSEIPTPYVAGYHLPGSLDAVSVLSPIIP